MDTKTFFSFLPVLIYFFFHPKEFNIFIRFSYNIFLHIGNSYIDYYREDENSYEIPDLSQEDKPNKLNQEKPRYEDKYLLEIRKMDKEFQFNEEEQQMRDQKFDSLVSEIFSVYEDKIQIFENELNEIETQYNKYNVSDEEFKQIIEEEKMNDPYYDEEWEDTYNKYNNESDRKRVILKTLILQKTNLKKDLLTIQENITTVEGNEKIITQAKEQSFSFIINERLDKLNNCYVMETTPQGNVLMIYDNKRNTFKYYSDNSIPYRYLEPVARKYVKLFNCRPIFVDMEEELRLAEERWEKERIEKEEKEDEEERKKKENENNSHIKKEEKKSVFAKFKSYNKDGASGKVNKVAPPKNSIPMTKEQENEKIILKEKANRYTYEGKMANFSFLKKIERKIVDKKYGLTFADFKRMNPNN